MWYRIAPITSLLLFSVFLYVCVCACSCLTSQPFSCALQPPCSANFRPLEIVVPSRLYPQPSFGTVLKSGSDLCVCGACALVFCVLILVCMCMFVLDPSAVFTRAVTPPCSANFRLLEIVVPSRLPPQSSFETVLKAGSDPSLVSVFVCLYQVSVLSCVFFCLSPYIHIHPRINCTYVDTCIKTCMLACMYTYILLSVYTFFVCGSLYTLTHCL
jgi:hypothetical protein